MIDGETVSGMTFELVGGHSALDFVNTLDWRFRATGPEELLNSYGDLLQLSRQSAMLNAKQVEKLIRTTSPRAAQKALHSARALREALADVLYRGLERRRPATATVKTLERYFNAAQTRQRLTWEESRLQWSWAEAESDPELPVWLLSSEGAELLSSEAIEMVRACDNTECRWLFMDTSKNHTRRWCDMKVCGNRMKARRFKAQHAS